MHRLSTLLGMPQYRFGSIHVVGTNGKSSVTRMTAALLEAHGLRSGAYLSPHASRWAERTLIGGREIEAGSFAAAVERAAASAESVNRGLEEGEAVTQFELATAAAFLAFAAARVDVAVIEAGLGGRLDATNTIPSRVTVLTSVGLDHTEWLGETEAEIAAEKLAVLRDHSTLVLGALAPEIDELARRTAAERGARVVAAPLDPGEGIRLAAAGSFQRRNFALARAAAEAYVGEPLGDDLVGAVAAGVTVPGRLDRVAEEPSVFLDVAHNPAGAAALAESLAEVAAGRPVVACLAVLADKDAAGIAGALAPALDRVVATELPSFPADGTIDSLESDQSSRRRSVGAAELARAFERAGAAATAEPDFPAALRAARALARERDGIVVVSGSHYVLAPARMALGLCED